MRALEGTLEVLRQVNAERQAQIVKWGEQSHPDVDLVLIQRSGGCTPAQMAEHYEIPTAARAKFLCQNAGDTTGDTYAHILIEEVAEAVEAASESAQGLAPMSDLKTELIQVAAVAVAWVEKLIREGVE